MKRLWCMLVGHRWVDKKALGSYLCLRCNKLISKRELFAKMTKGK